MRFSSVAAFAALSLVPVGLADAHISINSGPAQIDRNGKITFAVGHGCEGHDTVKVRVVIPAGIDPELRVMPHDLFEVSIEGTHDAVSAVVWEKPANSHLDGDYGYYELSIRAKAVPEAVFTTLAFRVEQTCEGVAEPVIWDGEDAAHLVVLPQRRAGWNRLVMPAPVLADDLGTYFADATIVWRGAEAFSPNANVASMIAMTPGVSALASDLAAGDEIWVKY